MFYCVLNGLLPFRFALFMDHSKTSIYFFLSCTKSLYVLFYLFILSDRDTRLDTPQLDVLGDVSFHKEILGSVTRDHSLYYILKVWQGDDLLEWDQENRDRLFRLVTIINSKTVIEELGRTYNAFEKIVYNFTELETSRQRLCKYNSFEKSLKYNINLFCCNRGYARKSTDFWIWENTWFFLF